MKKILLFSLLSGFLAASCDTGFSSAHDEYTQKRFAFMEKQISFLERRVTELEKQKSASPTKKASALVIKRNVTFELDDGYFDDPYFGSEDTSRIMILYTDLQCDACKSFLSATLPELKKMYGKSDYLQVRIRDFPLSKSPLSKYLAMGAHCAGEKGKYWDFLRIMLEMEVKDKDDIPRIAERIPSLDLSAFTSCLSSGKYAREVEIDKAHARALGITGTPGIVIGKKTGTRLYSGSIIRGSQPLGLLLDELKFLN
jgi:protein-disulfide isomerase